MVVEWVGLARGLLSCVWSGMFETKIVVRSNSFTRSFGCLWVEYLLEVIQCESTVEIQKVSL